MRATRLATTRWLQNRLSAASVDRVDEVWLVRGRSHVCAGEVGPCAIPLGEAHETITVATDQESPRWVYFLTERHLECQAGYQAVSRLTSVRSPRSVAVLNNLAHDLHRRQRSPHVAPFLPKLDSALSVLT